MDESFKERVRLSLISAAKDYKEKLVDYEYLVCSESFKIKDFYIINAKEDNYQHLTGVHSLVDAKTFFDKCYNGTLLLSDFDFVKRGQSEKSVKGSVRRKISILPHMLKLFESSLMAEEGFEKNNVRCTFATTDGQYTIGFIDADKARPKTLIKGNELKADKSQPVLFSLRKKCSNALYDEIVYGEISSIKNYKLKLEHLVTDNILSLLD